MITARRPTWLAPFVSESYSVARPRAVAGFSQTLPPSVPKERTRMSSSGTPRPRLWSSWDSCWALAVASSLRLLPL